MKTSENGLALIKKYEGCRLKAYALGDGKITIGWGHAEDIGKSTYKLGESITQSKADELLVNDLKKYEAKVNKYSSYNWTQNEFDALVSFCYNIGSIDQLTANGTRSKTVIADKMDEYISKGTKFEKGLTERRKAEQKLFLSVVTSQDTTVPSKEQKDEFQVKITTNKLYIRASIKGTIVGSIKDKGIYTIVQTKDNWGELKSGLGWICLDYTKRI